MFLSRVELPWELARNPYDFHRQLWRLFPGEAKETRRNDADDRQGFLFRVEENETGRPARFLVQSRILPKATAGLIVLGVPRASGDEPPDDVVAIDEGLCSPREWG